jgi:PAS domain S-box-containing protein
LLILLKIIDLIGGGIIKKNITRPEKDLSKAHERLDLCLSVGNLAWWEMDVKTGKVIFNENKVKMLGYDMNDFKNADYKSFTKLLHPDDHDRVMQAMKDHLEGKKETYDVEYRIKAKNGNYKWYYDKGSIVERDQNGSPLIVKGIVIDVSNIKQSEILEKLSNKILDRLNLSGNKVNQIRDILFLIKQNNDFEAVGIRIKEKGFFPYYETNGFPASFVKEANKICKTNLTDNLKNNFYGCMCGKIIRGKTNVNLPFFTDYGSFWTNDLSKLLKENPNNIREYFSLNNCIEEDYHSIAIIPIKTDNEIIGLLQINDKRRDIFSNKIIVSLEIIASSIAIAFVRDEVMKDLEINERRYRLAQKAANIGSWDWNIETGDLTWSEKIEPMFGFKKGKFGRTYEAFLNTVHPDDRDYVKKSVNDCVENKKRYAIEHRIVWPNGTIRWVLERGDVIRDKNDKPKRMLGVVQDITINKEMETELKKRKNQLEKMVEDRTQELLDANKKLKDEINERKKAEVYIERAKENLRNVIDSASELIISFDMNNRISTWNKSAEIITGYKQIEVLNRSIGKLDFFENPDNIIENIDLICGNKPPSFFDIIIKTKRNDKRILRFTGTEIKSSNNECIGVLFIGKDITKEIELHKKLLGGNSYIITDKKYYSSIDLLVDLTINDFRGLIITRGNPDQIIKEVPKSKYIEIVLLTSEQHKDFINISNFEKLLEKIKQFSKKYEKTVILLDGIHYLISRFSFQEFIKALYDINDIIAKNKAILLVRIDPSTIESNQLALIENELMILPSQKTEDLIIEDDLFNILKYIFEQNQENAIVSVKKVMSKFNITYVTAATRLGSLESKGLLITKKQGKLRAIFITEKGKKLLHKRKTA